MNAAVAKAITVLTEGDRDIQDGLRCAYVARDRLHDLANGMRTTLGMPQKNPN